MIEFYTEKQCIVVGIPEKVNKFYLFKFFSGEELLFSKIGTTKRCCLTRLREEIKEYSKQYHISKATIELIVDCGDFPAEGLESYCRSMIIKMCPSDYKKDDRFLFDVTVEDVKKMIQDYIS